MSKKRRVNPQEVINMYVNMNMSTSDISKTLNYNTSSICKILKENNIRLRPPKPNIKGFYDGENKECTICKKIKSVKEFQKSKGSKTTGIRGECNECRYKIRSKWYNSPGKKEELKKKRRIYSSNENNKVKRRKQMKKYWNKNKQYIENIKDKLCCQICGENRKNCLEFHHIIPINKRGKKNRVCYFYTQSLTRCLEELTKCALLCANCHKLVHSGDITQTLAPIDITPYLPTT